MQVPDTANREFITRDSQLPDRRVILEARGISKSFGGFVVLDDLTVDLRVGDVVLLRGDNGSGKTTLLNILTGNLEPDSGELTLAADGTPERFSFPRRWWREMNPFDHFTPEKVAGEQIGRAWQDLRLFPSLTLGENLMVASAHQHGENPIEALLRPRTVAREEAAHRSRATQLLVSLGLDGFDHRKPDQVSLGQAKRAAIARALQAEARILFLDEPLSGLDETGIEQILDFIAELIRLYQLTVVVVEHSFHIPRLLRLATRVWTMKEGKVIFEDPSEVRLQMEAESVMTSLETAVGPGRTRERKRFVDGAELTVFRSASSNGSGPVIELRDWIVKRGDRIVAGGESAGMCFSLKAGDIGVLRAPNGWGKTTLAESLAGLLPSFSGSLLLNGRPVEAMDTWDRSAAGISFVQSRNRVFPSLSVQEMLRLSHVSQFSVVPTNLIARRVDQLSGGERQRVTLACAFSQPNTSVLILDEPFNMLDVAAITDLKQKLAACANFAVLILMPAIFEPETHRRLPC